MLRRKVNNHSLIILIKYIIIRLFRGTQAHLNVYGSQLKSVQGFLAVCEGYVPKLFEC